MKKTRKIRNKHLLKENSTSSGEPTGFKIKITYNHSKAEEMNANIYEKIKRVVSNISSKHDGSFRVESYENGQIIFDLNFSSIQDFSSAIINGCSLLEEQEVNFQEVEMKKGFWIY